MEMSYPVREYVDTCCSIDQPTPHAPRKARAAPPHNPRVLPGTQLQIRVPPSRRPLFPGPSYRAPEDLTPPRAPRCKRTRPHTSALAQSLPQTPVLPQLSPVCRILEFNRVSATTETRPESAQTTCGDQEEIHNTLVKFISRSTQLKSRHSKTRHFKNQQLPYQHVPVAPRLFADDSLNSDGEENDSPKQQIKSSQLNVKMVDFLPIDFELDLDIDLSS